MRKLTLALTLSLALGCAGVLGTDDATGADTDNVVEDIDTDGDGLTDSQEAELGTDPESVDSDGDLFEDGAEVDADSDPASCMSVPEGDGNWANCVNQMAWDGVEGSTWADDGEALNDFMMVDQFGNEVTLHQFYGHVVMVDFSAGWCGPCRTLAVGAEDMYQEYKDDDVIFLHVMIDDNNYNPPDQAFIDAWTAQYGLTFPVGAPENGQALNGLGRAGIYEGGIPFQLVLNRDLSVAGSVTGVSEARLASIIEGAI
jgi:thiol-disulfide isomerase/thioredoxin